MKITISCPRFWGFTRPSFGLQKICVGKGDLSMKVFVSMRKVSNCRSRERKTM
jgi:hypothetical protein